jgi:hypothetical protein
MIVAVPSSPVGATDCTVLYNSSSSEESVEQEIAKLANNKIAKMYLIAFIIWGVFLLDNMFL